MAEDDRMPIIGLTQWKAGRVLDDQDIKDLDAVFKEWDESTVRQVDVMIAAEEEVMRRLGGEALVKAMHEETVEQFDIMVQKAMQTFYKRRAELTAERKKQ